MNDPNWSTDNFANSMTYKTLRRAWKEFSNHRPAFDEEWLNEFFKRVTFVRVMWSVRKRDREKYWRIVRADWKAITGTWIRHRKMWRKYMAGYSNVRAGDA